MTGGALSFEDTPVNVPAGVSISGVVDDAGNVTVPTSGLVFPDVSPLGLTGTLTQVATGSGTFNDASGAMTLNLPLRIAVSGGPLDASCTIGSATTPILLTLETAGSTPTESGALAGAPFNRATGQVALVDEALQLPAGSDCTDSDDTALVETFRTMKWKLGLSGPLNLPAKPTATPNPVPTPPTQQQPAPVVSQAVLPSTSTAQKRLAKLLLSGPATQKGLKNGGTSLGVELDQPATVVVTPTVKIGAKPTKLPAVTRRLKTGRASVAVSFPRGLRQTVQRALRNRKRVVVTFAVTATDASGARLTRSRQIRLTR